MAKDEVKVSRQALNEYNDFIAENKSRVDAMGHEFCKGMVSKLERYLADPRKTKKYPEYKLQLEKFQRILSVFEAAGE